MNGGPVNAAVEAEKEKIEEWVRDELGRIIPNPTPPQNFGRANCLDPNP